MDWYLTEHNSGWSIADRSTAHSTTNGAKTLRVLHCFIVEKNLANIVGRRKFMPTWKNSRYLWRSGEAKAGSPNDHKWRQHASSMIAVTVEKPFALARLHMADVFLNRTLPPDEILGTGTQRSRPCWCAMLPYLLVLLSARNSTTAKQRKPHMKLTSEVLRNPT